MGWDALEEYADFTRDFLAAVEAAFESGKTVDEAMEGLELADRYQNYGMANARVTVEAIYEERTSSRANP